jgi:hypothetical protein
MGCQVQPYRPAGIMPLRPLTLGELMDAAVSLLRGQARVLLVAAVLCAATEQAALYPLRLLAGLHPPFYAPYTDRLGLAWLVFGVGLGTEAAIIAVLGGFGGAAAGPGLLGQGLSGRVLRATVLRRLPGLLVVAAVAGVVAAMAALAGLLPWIFLYGLIGLAAPALVVERVNPLRAVGRSFALASRAGLRGVWVRLAGYLGWLALRLALGFGGIATLDLVLPSARGWVPVASVAVWTAVNAVAYATLACLDAVLYLEVRMRTEGLDLAVGRDLHRGRPVDLALT